MSQYFLDIEGNAFWVKIFGSENSENNNYVPGVKKKFLELKLSIENRLPKLKFENI